MNKVTPKSFRKEKEFTLPECGVTLTCYASMLIGEVMEFGKKETTPENNLEFLVKVIKEWNYYLNESDETPAPINLENVLKLPATDFTYLTDELKKFADEVKKK